MSKNPNKKKDRRKCSSKNSAGSRALAQAKLMLIKSPIPSAAVSTVRDFLGTANYAPFLSWLRNQSKLYARTFANPFPNTLQELRPYSAPRPRSLVTEFRWCYYCLEPHISRLSSFNQLREEIETAFIAGQKDQCFDLLASLEQEYGTSIWLLKRKVAFLQHFEGLEQQKNFSEEIKGKESLNSIIPYLIHYVSYRSEPTVSPITFEVSYESLLLDLQLGPEITPYLRHHITGVSPSTHELAAMLCIETAGTAIDAYEMFVAVAQIVVANDQQALYPSIVPILQKLSIELNDIRLSRLLFFATDNNYEGAIRPTSNDNFQFLFRSHEKSFPFIKPKVVDDGFSVSRLIAALTIVVANSPGESLEVPVSHEIFNSIKSILLGSDERIKAAAVLQRTVWALDGSCAANLLRLVLDWSENARLDARGQSEWIKGIVGLGQLSPFEFWWILDPSLRARYVGTFAREGTKFQPWLLFEDDEFSRPFTDLDVSANPLLAWRAVNQLLRTGDDFLALTIAKELLKEENLFLKKQAVRAIPHCLHNLGKIHECICFLAEQAISDPSLKPVLPTKDVFDSLTDEEKASMAGSLDFAVFTDLYVSRSPLDLAYLRSFAAEDFLSENSLERPSELRNHTNSYQHSLLIYFLRNMCIESVMDSWVVFSGSQEVATERASICQLLSELDSDNREEYQAQIRDIMRRLTLSKRLREVEQSKIHVDTSSVKIVARQTLLESFNRYMDFVRTGMSPEEKSILLDTRKRVARGDIESLLSDAFPRNEMTELFESIVARLRDEFVSSSQHGLDGYLSVRVRHGTLAGQLRGPLEAENLVTLCDSKSGDYKTNTFWPETLDLKDNTEITILQDALSEFTASFDALIEEMKSSWLQIKKAPEGLGLIDFTLLRPEVNYLSTGVREDMSFDAFLEYVFTYFFSEKLEPSLMRIRQDLQNRAKPQVNSMLLKLQTTVEDALGTETTCSLRSAIGRARGQIQNVLDRITEWFRLSTAEMLREPFSIEEAVNIGTASIRASCPDFQANLKLSEELQNFQISGSLPSFVDLLFLVFENAVRHSQLFPSPVVDITVSLSGDILCIHAENELGAGVSGAGSLDKVELIRNNLKFNVFSPYVKMEGGTGFYKMQKILHHDFLSPSGDRKPTLDFGISENDRFFVNMTIPVYYLEGKEIVE